MTSTRSARRMPRLALLACLGAVVSSSGAMAAGTGGIEVTPVPSQRDGKAITTFRVDVPSEGSVQIPYLLSNVEDEPRSARVYAARVTRDGASFALDEPGSSPYVDMPDRQVTLQPGEAREESFTVSAPDGELPDDTAYAAVVVEVRNGAVVQRANTLIYLERGASVPLPLVIVVLAVLLLAFAGTGVLVHARRRRASG